MAAQMIMVGFRDAAIDENANIHRHISQGYVANVILFDIDMTVNGSPRNIRSPEQLANLVATLKKASPNELWVGIDQEGGTVQRLKSAYGFSGAFPTARELGKKEETFTYQTAREIGAELKKYGFGIDCAPVADLDIDPDSPAIGRKQRSFSRNPDAAYRHIAAYGKGLVNAGIIPCLKHFPGHGSARNDTHEGVTDVTSTWNKEELLPYIDAIRDGWPGAIMTAHVFTRELDARFPTSLSRKITTDLLRGELAWNGVIITDDLHMGAIAKQYRLDEIVLLAINAGAVMLVFSNNSKDMPYDDNLGENIHKTIIDLLQRGAISKERLFESWQRIMALKKTL